MVAMKATLLPSGETAAGPFLPSRLNAALSGGSSEARIGGSGFRAWLKYAKMADTEVPASIAMTIHAHAGARLDCAVAGAGPAGRNNSRFKSRADCQRSSGFLVRQISMMRS